MSLVVISKSHTPVNAMNNLKDAIDAPDEKVEYGLKVEACSWPPCGASRTVGRPSGL